MTGTLAAHYREMGRAEMYDLIEVLAHAGEPTRREWDARGVRAFE